MGRWGISFVRYFAYIYMGSVIGTHLVLCCHICFGSAVSFTLMGIWEMDYCLVIYYTRSVDVVHYWALLESCLWPRNTVLSTRDVLVKANMSRKLICVLREWMVMLNWLVFWPSSLY